MPEKIPEHYELYIGFVGLAAFVPRTETLAGSGSDVVTRMTAILPRVVEEDAYAKYTTADGKELPTHQAKLKLIVGGVDGNPAPEPYVPQDKKMRKAFKLAGIEPRSWGIDRQEISFHHPNADGEVMTVLRTVRGHGDPFPFDRLELSDTTWLSSIREVFDGAKGTQSTTDPGAAGRIDLQCLISNPPRVGARIELPRGGCLASLGLVEHKKRILRYGYESLHPDSTCEVSVNRAISQNVILRLPIHDPTGQGVVLRSKSLDDGPQWKVTLTPKNLFGRSKIILVVDHQPASNGNHEHHPGDAVAHFEVFYELSKSKPDMKDRPVPRASSERGKHSMGVILPGAGWLDALSRKPNGFRFGQSLAKIKLAKAVVSALKKDTGPICPQSTFAAEPDS